VVNGLKSLLVGRVNELLGEIEDVVPPVEFGAYRGGSVVVPAVTLASGERTEKERILRADAYSLSIGFAVPEGPDSERRCYAYAGAVKTALLEDPTLGGAADRAELTGKKYVPPHCPGTGEGWAVVLMVRVETNEE
jgi:hypothetical protein